MINQQNFDKLQEEVDKKYNRRKKKRRGKMKVSGAGVKRLQRIIKDRNNSMLSLRGARGGRRSDLG